MSIYSVQSDWIPGSPSTFFFCFKKEETYLNKKRLYLKYFLCRVDCKSIKTNLAEFWFLLALYSSESRANSWNPVWTELKMSTSIQWTNRQQNSPSTWNGRQGANRVCCQTVGLFHTFNLYDPRRDQVEIVLRNREEGFLGGLVCIHFNNTKCNLNGLAYAWRI